MMVKEETDMIVLKETMGGMQIVLTGGHQVQWGAEVVRVPIMAVVQVLIMAVVQVPIMAVV